MRNRLNVHGVAVSIVYETHSKSTDNEAGFATGWLPGKLSEEGRRQAVRLGERRRNDGIAVIYVSDLERALETVRIAFDGSDIPVVVDSRLRECNYGRLNGMPRASFEDERADHIDTPWPEGESYLDVVGRMREFLGDVLLEWDNHRVLIVAHAANRFALQHLLEGRDLNELVVGDFSWQEGWEFELAKLPD
jgi:alpha-ribazole phosphatase/probable phosphoglycerate mutase